MEAALRLAMKSRASFRRASCAAGPPICCESPAPPPPLAVSRLLERACAVSPPPAAPAAGWGADRLRQQWCQGSSTQTCMSSSFAAALTVWPGAAADAGFGSSFDGSPLQFPDPGQQSTAALTAGAAAVDAAAAVPAATVMPVARSHLQAVPQRAIVHRATLQQKSSGFKG